LHLLLLQLLLLNLLLQLRVLAQENGFALRSKKAVPEDVVKVQGRWRASLDRTGGARHVCRDELRRSDVWILGLALVVRHVYECTRRMELLT
jgi:hypothetical protein